MNLKHYNLLKIAGYINMFLGLVIIIISLGEFSGILQTNANNVIKTASTSLSILVFISGIFCALSGGITVFLTQKKPKINLQVFAGIISLSWPVFVSIALLFSNRIICIRLLPATLSSLFYVIVILIFKISNEALKKSLRFNPEAIFKSMGKRNKGIDIMRSIANSTHKPKIPLPPKIQELSKLNKYLIPTVSPLKMLFNNTRRRSFSFSNLLCRGSRRLRFRKIFRKRFK